MADKILDFLKGLAEEQAEGIEETYGAGVYGSSATVPRQATKGTTPNVPPVPQPTREQTSRNAGATGSGRKITEDEVRSAGKDLSLAGKQSFGASLSLGASLIARGGNPFSDSIPELQRNVDDSLKNLQTAQQNKAKAQERYNSLATAYQDQEEKRKYSSLQSNPDFLSKSKGDEETARRAATTPTKQMGEYYQIYHRNDKYDPEKGYTPGSQEVYYSDSPYRYMTDEEAGIYFYLWNSEKQGPKAASAYLDTISSRLNERRANQRNQELEAYAHDSPVLSSVVSIPSNAFSIAGVVDLTIQNAKRQFGGSLKPIDYNTPAQDFGKDANRIRETVAKDLEEKYPDKQLLGVANLASFAYMTGMSMADSGSQILLNMLGVPEWLTLGMMAGSAAQQSVYDAKERGATDGEALMYGYAAGIAEYLFEKVSLDHFVDSFVKKTGKSIGQSVASKAVKEGGGWFSDLLRAVTQGIVDSGVQAGIEASEEGFTTLANTVTDIAINKGNAELFSNIQKKVNAGEKYDEAVRSSIKEWAYGLLTDALGGLISGGLMGGAGTFGNVVNTATGRNQAESGLRIPVAPQAAQNTPESVTTPPLPGNPQRAAEGQREAAPEGAAKADSNELIAKLRDSRSQMAEMPSVASVKGDEFEKSGGKLTDQVGAFFKRIGNAVLRKGFGTVILDERGVKNDIAHGIGRAKAATFAAVPNVIADGTQIDYQQNWKNRGSDSYVFAAPVDLAGKRTYVAAVVLQDQNNRFYLHEVLDEDGNLIYKIDVPADIKTGVPVQDGVTGTAETSGDNVAQQGETVKGPPVPGQALQENSPPAPQRTENATQQQSSERENQEAGLRIPPVPARAESREGGLRIAGEKSSTKQQALAQQRQRQEENTWAESLRDRGFQNAGAGESVYVRSEERWDKEERAVAEALRAEGIEPIFVTGLLQDAQGNKVNYLRDGNRIAIQADNLRQSVQSIAERAVGKKLLDERAFESVGEAAIEAKADTRSRPVLTIGAANATVNQNEQEARNGQQAENPAEQRTGAGEAENGAAVSAGDGGRGTDQRSGGQAGKLAESAEEWRSLGQRSKAARRRLRAESKKISGTDGRELGIYNADGEVTVYPESEWDDDLRNVAERVQKATGMPVTFVLGEIPIKGAGTARARGVMTGDRIIVQCDHPTISAAKLASHEAFHAWAAKNSEQFKKLADGLIREMEKRQGGNRIKQTVDAYLKKTLGISDLNQWHPSETEKREAIMIALEEFCADAYGGINAYGQNAGRYQQFIRDNVYQQSETAAATDRRTGPPAGLRLPMPADMEKSSAEGVSGSKETRRDLRDRLIRNFSIPDGYKTYIKDLIGDYEEKILKNGSLTEDEKEDLFDELYESGARTVAADEATQAARDMILKAKIYVPESVKHEFSDDWAYFQRQAFGQKIILTNNPADQKIDVFHQEIADAFPHLFDPDDTDPRSILENIVKVADEGKGKSLSLAEYNRSDEGHLEGDVFETEEELRQALREDLDRALEDFAGRTGSQRLSAAEDTDAEYMAAAEAGDTETAQRMVNEAAEAAGYTIHAYHGTGRADRVGNVFRADRATSGPMAFFTDSKDIAENYSRDKRDTSLAYDTDYDSYETQFRAKHTKTGKDFAIYKMWGYIPLSERAKIKEKARHVRANWEGEGEIIYDPQATEANGGWSHQLQEFRGDVLKALNEQWLNSGNLFNEEEQYLKVLELAGVTDALKKAGFEMPRYMNPDYREEAVYDVFLKIQNPFDATSMIDEDFIQGFEDFAVDNEERFTKESVDADYWDKNSVSAEEFVERMRNDLENGVTHAWTSIPDVMSEYLKSLGYDGIKDAGGKNGGQGHTVWIPFTSEQIKRTDPITYDDAGNIIPLSERFNPEEKDIRYSAAEERELGSREVLDTPALRKLGVKVSGSVGEYGQTAQLIAKDRAAKELQKEAARAERRLKATDAEKEFANGITAGIYREEDIPKRLNRDTVMELADYYWAMNSANLQTLHQLRTDINQGLRDDAAGYLEETDIRPISMIELNERTPERAFRKMFGDNAEAITKWLLDPVKENTAEADRWYNKQMDAVRKFTDSKGKSRELTRAESALTMRFMEGRAAADMVAGMEMKAAITNAAENIRKGGDAGDEAREFGLSGQERDLAEKYAGWLSTQEELKKADSTIVEAAAKKYAELFDDYYNAINDFLVAHGYEPIGYIKGYAPHMQPEENQSLLEKAFEKMGINAAVSELPASIAGQTTFFKPNKRWDPYFLHRTGTEAEYDIVKAYQSYVDYMTDILFHTDDVMRVRQTANWIRQTYAPEEIRANLDWAQGLRNASTEEKQRLLRDAGEIGQNTVLSAVDTTKAMQEYIDKLYERISNSTKNSNLVMWLDNYANILAGKQSFADRGWEYSTGRKSLNLANKLNNAFQKANVAGNLSSALNQTAQLPMIAAELGERDFLKAAADLASGKTKAWAQDSDFLTAKAGREQLYTDNAEKFVNALFTPASVSDYIVSTIAVRGAFNKAIRQGASYAEAMKKADEFGTAVMGSRAKGSRPLAYESKGFFSKMVHMFQLEAVNSWDHIVSDVPYEIRRIAKTDGKGKAAGALAALIVRALVGAFTLNRLAEELYGGTPAPFDILGLTANFVASGKGLTTNQYIRTIIDNTMEKMGYERLFGTEQKTREDFDMEAAADDLLYNVMNDVPLVRNAAGMLGLGDQTIALPGAGGEFKAMGTAIKNLIKDGREQGEVENLVRATLLTATQFIPGGRQISKTAQGAEAILRGGSYNSYKAPKLQYPLEDATDIVKALLFGKNATNAAQEYWASGGKQLTEKQTALYTSLASHGVGRKEAYDAIQEYRRIANDDSLTSYERGKAERALLAGLDIPDEDKLDMYRELNNAEGRAEKFRAIMNRGLSFDQVMTIQDKYAEIDNKEELKAGDKAKEFSLWVDKQAYTAKQRETIKDQLKYFQSIPAEATRYEKLTASGLSPDMAASVDKAIGKLTPEAGKEDVSDLQKWQAAIKAVSGDVNQKKALQALMTKEQYDKFETASEAGISAGVYVQYKAGTKNLTSDKDENGKTISGSLKKKVVDYIDGLDLTADQKTTLLLDYNSTYSTKDVTWHSGGGKGSGSYAMARTPALRIPEAPKAEKIQSGLRISTGTNPAPRQSSGLRIPAAASAAPRQSSGLRIRAK